MARPSDVTMQLAESMFLGIGAIVHLRLGSIGSSLGRIDGLRSIFFHFRSRLQGCGFRLRGGNFGIRCSRIDGCMRGAANGIGCIGHCRASAALGGSGLWLCGGSSVARGVGLILILLRTIAGAQRGG